MKKEIDVILPCLLVSREGDFRKEPSFEMQVNQTWYPITRELYNELQKFKWSSVSPIETITPTFKLEPGDGTGTSINDAIVRNRDGLCKVQGCGKPFCDTEAPEGRKMCKDHAEDLDAFVKDLRDKIVENFDRSIIERESE
jgi:hypothetical protein